MENAQQLAGRIREVTLNGTWIAHTNFKSLLEQVDFKMATKQLADLNTIAALTFHVNYYMQGFNVLFEGGELSIRDKYSFDMELLQSNEEWLALKERLFTNAERFAQHVESFTDAQLAAPFVKEEYGSYRRNIEALIEHNYYHLGQVSLIRKLILNQQ